MICEKCGFVPAQPGKFCEKCGSSLVAAQEQDAPIPEDTFAVFNDILPDPIEQAPEAAFAAPQQPGIQEEALVYNPEVVAEAVDQPEQEPAFVPVQVEEAPAPNQEIPAVPVQEAPAAPMQETPAVSFQTPPAGAPLFSAPAYHGAIPNAVPTYYGNAPAYGGQGYPNMPGYYAVPVYGAVPYAPNGQPAYAAAPQQGYAPAAPLYYAPTTQPETAPAPDDSLASNKKAAKKFSGLAFVGALIALMALFFEVISYSGNSIFDLVKELPDIIKDIDQLKSLDTMLVVFELVLLVGCILCGIFAVVLFLMACFKANCRPLAIISLVVMLLSIIAVCCSTFVVLPGDYWSDMPKNHELAEQFLRVPGSGAWLYIIGMLLASFGRNRKKASGR